MAVVCLSLLSLWLLWLLRFVVVAVVVGAVGDNWLIAINHCAQLQLWPTRNLVGKKTDPKQPQQ